MSVFSILCLFVSLSYSQKEGLYFIEKGEIIFLSYAPLELIEAHSQEIKGVIKEASNTFAFSVTLNSFSGFNSKLQLEHFQEKYMETDLYPKATFVGKFIEKIDFSQEGSYEVRAKGILEIHGEKQERIIKGTLLVKKGKIQITTQFKVPLAEHNIAIPELVNQKIAEEMIVKIKAGLIEH